jgi:plastocyanin
MNSTRFAPPNASRRGRRLALGSLALALTVGLSGTLAAAPPTKTVDIAKFAFVPNDITIEPGTRVRWTNHDETPHTVTSQAGKKVLSSPGLDLDDRYEFVFTDEGDYAYFCTVHPMMTAVVHVRKAGSKAP